MRFDELVDQIKKIPLEELRKESGGYFECVIDCQCIEILLPLLNGYFGEPFKPAGVRPSNTALLRSEPYGGVLTPQTLYFKESSNQLPSACAIIWPWNDGRRATLKLACDKPA